MKAKAVILLLFAFVVCGCEEFFMPKSFTAVEEERAQLIDGIESYQSITEFLALLEENSMRWELYKVTSLGKTKRPPLDLLSIKIPDFTHLGFSGVLYVQFFNNRLAWTSFYPDDFDGYLDALAREGIILKSDITFKTSTFAEIRIKEHSERGALIEKSVEWFDIRLDKEFDIWHYRYT